MQRLIFVDFDNTIFDAKNFINELAKIFEKYGGINFFETAAANKAGHYSLENHLFSIPTKHQRKRVKRELRKLFSSSARFLFSDLKEFLSCFANDSETKLILITRGEKSYQRRKVYQAMAEKMEFDNNFVMIRSFFNRIVIADELSKSLHIQEMIGNYGADQAFFIDDNFKELAEAKTLVPLVKTFLIDRYDQSDNSASVQVDFFVHNLNEAIKIIRSSG